MLAPLVEPWCADPDIGFGEGAELYNEEVDEAEEAQDTVDDGDLSSLSSDEITGYSTMVLPLMVVIVLWPPTPLLSWNV